METVQQDMKNPCTDSLIPTIAADGQILDIGIADAVANRPSHSYDILSFHGSHKTVAACNQLRDKMLTFAIGRLPPPLRSVEVNDLTHLMFRRHTEDNRGYPTGIFCVYHFHSTTQLPFVRNYP